MKNTYTQLRYHLVFSTKNRLPLITGEIRDALYDYIGGIIRGQGGTLLAAGGMPDHIHLLAGWGTTLSISEMLKRIKGSSSHWMNDGASTRPGFSWQEGYGAFTVSASQLDIVKRYILSQEAHHQKVSFLEEFKTLLERHGIDFDPASFTD